MHISTAERRAGVVERHHLRRTAEDPVAATAALLAVHSSDPATPYLSMWPRVDSFETDDLDAALYTERTLWRLHAMRRTLFIVETAAAALFDGGAAQAIARKERERVIGWLAEDVGEPGAARLLDDLTSEVLEALAGNATLRTRELADMIPGLKRRLRVGSGKWAGTMPLSSRLLYLLAMEGMVVRANPAGSWRSSQYSWAVSRSWFDSIPDPVPPEEARAALLTRYLESYGPATETDIRWWTGWTARDARAAIEAIEADRVTLDGAGSGFVAPGYEASLEELDAVALLPALDSTAMGWKERDWYVPPEHVGDLFDRNGNIGPTVWVNGRVVGAWAQSESGTIIHRLVEAVDSSTSDRVDVECTNLGEWLGDARVTPRFRAPLERELAG